MQFPCWSVIEFWKIKLEKSISTNWIFSLQTSISKLIFAGYTGSKNQVRNRLKIQFVELDFSKLIFQKSSTDQQGYWLMGKNFVTVMGLAHTFGHCLTHQHARVKIGNCISLWWWQVEIPSEFAMSYVSSPQDTGQKF